MKTHLDLCSSAPQVVQSAHAGAGPQPRWLPLPGLLLATVLLAGGVLWQVTSHAPLISLRGKAESWAALSVAICLQAFPFLVLGVLLSAAIATFAPPALLQRLTPRNPLLAVPAAAAAGVLLPGCECSSVPVARSLMQRGLSPAAGLSFLLAAPSLNPVVMVSTAVAFYSLPAMAWARFGAGLLTVVLAGWLWLAVGDNKHLRAEVTCGCCHLQASRRDTFVGAALHDLTQAASYLVIGAMIAAVVKVWIPAAWFRDISHSPLLAILVMAGLAILLALCSEADAFVAASFGAVSPTAQLVFLVVGPVIDIKLIAMQGGTFGWAFTRRFLPLVLLSALASASFVGYLIFGQI